jgi:hypothetical protein
MVSLFFGVLGLVLRAKIFFPKGSCFFTIACGYARCGWLVAKSLNGRSPEPPRCREFQAYATESLGIQPLFPLYYAYSSLTYALGPKNAGMGFSVETTWSGVLNLVQGFAG